MKTLTYAAAIALLAAGTAFAQTNTNNSSTINNSTPTPAARGAAEGTSGASNQSGAMMNQSGSATQPGPAGRSDRTGGMNQPSSMDQSNNMDHARGKASTHASNTRSRANRHVAMNGRNSRIDAKENQETMELNRQQLANAGSTGPAMGGGNIYGQGGDSQTAQSPNERGNPPMPTQKNPAINSVPQQRTYGASPR